MAIHLHSYRTAIAGALLAACVLLPGASAFGYQEPNAFTGSGCIYCHPGFATRPPEGGDCDACHAPYGNASHVGPHGDYTTSSRKCEACHVVHQALSGGIKLLAGATVKDSCEACHDGTGGSGVYGTIAARGGPAPAAQHRCETTNVILGGDATTGGSATRVFRGTSGDMTCSDCHSPHGADVVAAFVGDRKRVRSAAPNPVTSKLLKKTPTGASASVAEYGSDWCLACHAGRAFGGAVHNHPADSGADAFTYGNVAVLASDDPTATTVLGPLGGVPLTDQAHWLSPTVSGNRGFLMPYPRTPQQGTHKPICQQCHEDSRHVGGLSADGATGDADTARVAQADGVVWDGSAWIDAPSDNPLFQNFPHETQNPKMLVETGDDLCLNCHPAGALP